jgi:hypothetical protein
MVLGLLNVYEGNGIDFKRESLENHVQPQITQP